MACVLESRIKFKAPIIEPKWRCDACSTYHADESDAYDCCPNEITEFYFCPICPKQHLDEQAAIDCCGYEVGDEPPRISAEELERHGQLRIAGV
jgi:hypothetical protein